MPRNLENLRRLRAKISGKVSDPLPLYLQCVMPDLIRHPEKDLNKLDFGQALVENSFCVFYASTDPGGRPRNDEKGVYLHVSKRSKRTRSYILQHYIRLNLIP